MGVGNLALYGRDWGNLNKLRRNHSGEDIYMEDIYSVSGEDI